MGASITPTYPHGGSLFHSGGLIAGKWRGRMSFEIGMRTHGGADMRVSTASELAVSAERHRGIMASRGARYAYEEALAGCQRQGSSAHVGGRTAFSIGGAGMYGELKAVRALLFGQPGEALPRPLAEYDWGIDLVYLTPELLPPDMGLIELERGGFTLKVSNAARALMECIAAVPKWQDLDECYELMELRRSLEPLEVQALLEACASIPVKRAFLHLAERGLCRWAEQLDLTRIDLGEGICDIGSGGPLNEKFMLRIADGPEEFAC